MKFKGICMDILNGYQSKEFETIVELSHKVSGMCGSLEDYECKVEKRLRDSDQLPYARNEFHALHAELIHKVDDLLAKYPVEIAQAVRTIMFGIPDTAAFGAIAESVK